MYGTEFPGQNQASILAGLGYLLMLVPSITKSSASIDYVYGNIKHVLLSIHTVKNSLQHDITREACEELTADIVCFPQSLLAVAPHKYKYVGEDGGVLTPYPRGSPPPTPTRFFLYFGGVPSPLKIQIFFNPAHHLTNAPPHPAHFLSKAPPCPHPRIPVLIKISAD